jgi:hypothetical protein
MFAMQTDEGIDAVPDNDSNDARIFPVETNFQKMARRPGGILREQALMNAEIELRRVFKQSNRSSADKLVPVKRTVPDKSEPVKRPVADKLEPVNQTVRKKTLPAKPSSRSSGWLSTARGRKV